MNLIRTDIMKHPVHVYSTGAGADNLQGYFFQKHNYLVSLVLASFPPLNYFVRIFPIKTYRGPNLTLP